MRLVTAQESSTKINFSCDLVDNEEPLALAFLE